MKKMAGILCVLALLLCARGFAQENTLCFALVKGGWLHMRAQPDENALFVNSYQTGTLIRVLEKSENWCRAEGPDGQQGYMLAAYLTPVRGLISFAAIVRAKAGFVNLRSAPSLDGAVLARVNDASQVSLIRFRDGWFYLRYGELEGYMASEFLCLPAPNSGEEDTPIPTRASEAPTTAAPGVRKIDPARPMLALTFDDGPSEITPRILAALDAAGGRGTFFMVGERLDAYAGIVRQVAAQGSEIAVHSWTHRDLTKLRESAARREIENTGNAIERIAGVKPRLLRPPYGSTSRKLRGICGELGFAVVTWNVDPEDWKTRNAESTYRQIMAQARDGAIILSHDL
ncbi:MAG: hypothetical protein EOM69_10615, partial [Clostridia bacterium]|nr:hypothetical protein [Clostridia bacterium]